MSENQKPEPEPTDFYVRVGTEVKPKSAREVAEPTPALTEASADAASPSGDLALRRWAAHGNTFFGTHESYDRLPPGCYRAGRAEHVGVIFRKQELYVDDLIALPDSASEEIVAEFNQFWTIAHRFKERGFLHKRGYLLWGPAGSGKTCTIQLMCAALIKRHDGIILFIDHPGIAGQGLQLLRRIEPERPLIAILEDLDALVQQHGENEYLALLDGEAQVDKLVYVATTNYPERLDRRFVDRPSRFDTIKLIDMPTAKARRAYLDAKEPALAEEGTLDRWVRMSDGFSVAHLREMVIAVRCFEQPLEAVVERLRQMHEQSPKSDMLHRSNVGFIHGRQAGGDRGAG